MRLDQTALFVPQYQNIFETLSLNVDTNANISWNSARDPYKLNFYHFNKKMSFSFKDVYEQVIWVSSQISQWISTNQPIVIQLGNQVEFPIAAYAVWACGGTIVPVSNVLIKDSTGSPKSKGHQLIEKYNFKLIITTKKLAKFYENFPDLRVLIIEDLLLSPTAFPLTNENVFSPRSRKNSDSAIIQFTSGTTGESKGVIITDGAVLSNIYDLSIRNFFMQDTKIYARGCSWVPFYHDLGLIANLIFGLYNDVPMHFFSPEQFMMDPVSWLRMLQENKCNYTTGPNFAYRMLLALPDSDLKGLDLSLILAMIVSAETVEADVLEQFEKKFSKYGLGKNRVLPAYGLAENTLGVTQCPPNRKVARVCIDGLNAEMGARIRLFENMHGNADLISRKTNSIVSLVSLGLPLQQTRVEILGQNEEILPELICGEIVFCGTSCFSGYFMEDYNIGENKTNNIFHKTGDLGFKFKGELFFVARIKDIIVIRGVNFSPLEFESLVQELDTFKSCRVAAISVASIPNGSESLVIIAEIGLWKLFKRKKLEMEIKAKIVAQKGIAVDKLVLVPKKYLPRTSSGKLQRIQIKKEYLEGRLFLNDRNLFLLGLKPFVFRLLFQLIATGMRLYKIVK